MSPRRARPVRRARTHVAIPGDPTDPHGFCGAVTEWLGWLGAHNYSPATVHDAVRHLGAFVTWAEVRGIGRPADVTLPVLEAYQRHVAQRRKPDGMPLAWSTQASVLIPLKSFFAWATRTRRILYNPASELVLPKQNHSLPKPTLTPTEAEAVLALPDTGTVIGLRDRAILELLYATAMRRGEVVGLDLHDVDPSRNWLTLRETKGRFDRVVPMGERAGAWMARYLADARPELRCGSDPGAVFLTTNGERLVPGWLTAHVHRYLDASGVGKSGSCHIFRHTAATLMVERGADIRYVQELLGHRNLSTTAIYTRIAPEALAAVHRATHPGAALPATAACRRGDHEACPVAAGGEVPCGCDCHNQTPVPVVR
jgi:integrase/recombinase XerD